MKTCGYCGRKNEDGAEYCSECGTRVPNFRFAELHVTAEEKDWIESSMLWLLKEFTPEYF